MHGELKKQYMNEAHEKAMTEPIIKEEEPDVNELVERVRRLM
tara:strand:+ start:176 stop:301 length:126 start_codon:yes stop_codon:yes gene_type:complete